MTMQKKQNQEFLQSMGFKEGDNGFIEKCDRYVDIIDYSMMKGLSISSVRRRIKNGLVLSRKTAFKGRYKYEIKI